MKALEILNQVILDLQASARDLNGLDNKVAKEVAAKLVSEDVEILRVMGMLLKIQAETFMVHDNVPVTRICNILNDLPSGQNRV